MTARGVLIIIGAVIAVAGMFVVIMQQGGKGPEQTTGTRVESSAPKPSGHDNQATRVVLAMDSDGLSSDDIKTYFDSTISILRARCSEQFPYRAQIIKSVPPDTVIFNIEGALDCSVAHDILARRGRLELRLVSLNVHCETLIDRIDSTIVANSTVGDRDPHPFSSVLRRQTSPCEWYVWDDNKARIDDVLGRPELAPVIPDNLEFVWDARPHFADEREYNILHLTERDVSVDGDDVVNAAVDPSNPEVPMVAFQLSPDGARRLSRLTSANIGRPMAIIVDDGVVSAPVIQAEIQDQGMIALRSDATPDDAAVLALLLRHKPYPRALTVVDCRMVDRM